MNLKKKKGEWNKLMWTKDKGVGFSSRTALPQRLET